MVDILISTKKLSSQEWHKWRNKGIGGSDVATICGLNKYKSPLELWMEKLGHCEPKQAGEAAYWGTVLEAIIRDEFTRRTDLQVDTIHSILKHPKHHFMLANIDGIVNDPVQGKCIFEAKTASAYKLSQWENGIPEEYMLQIQHYMAVTGYSRTYIAALIGGNTFIHRVIDRDEELIAMIIRIEENFWNRITSNTPPALDGSEACSELLDRLYPTASKQHKIILTTEAEELITQYNNAREQEKSSNLLKEEAVNKLKALLGEHEVGIINNTSIVWKNLSNERLDSKKLKSDLPELYERYLAKSASRRFTIK